MVAHELGISEQTLRNWFKADAAGKLNGAVAKPFTAEQMELSRLRAENKRLQMDKGIRRACNSGTGRSVQPSSTDGTAGLYLVSTG